MRSKCTRQDFTTTYGESFRKLRYICVFPSCDVFQEVIPKTTSKLTTVGNKGEQAVSHFPYLSWRNSVILHEELIATAMTTPTRGHYYLVTFAASGEARSHVLSNVLTKLQPRPLFYWPQMVGSCGVHSDRHCSFNEERESNEEAGHTGRE